MKISKQKSLLFLTLLLLSIGNVFSQDFNLIKNQEFLSMKISRLLQTGGELVPKIQEVTNKLKSINADMSVINPLMASAFKGSPSSDYLTICFRIIKSIEDILDLKSSGTSLVSNAIILAFQTLTQQDAQTLQALNEVRAQVNALSNQIQILKTEVTSGLNELDVSIPYKNIDQDLYLLKAILFMYQDFQSSNSSDLIPFKQLCGNKMQVCNQSLVSITSGLKDYLKTMKASQNSNRVAVTSQYVLYSSLLLNSMMVLADVNVRSALKDLNIASSSLTIEQVNSYSQIYVFYKSELSLKKDFDNFISSYSETQIVSLNFGLKTYNDLSPVSPNGLLVGLYRSSGDLLNSINYAKVVARNIEIKNAIEIDSSISLDNNNTWISCPQNSFLKGITFGPGTNIQFIDSFTCVTFKDQYTDTCSDVDVSMTSNSSWGSCPDGTFVTGMYRGNGDTLAHITRFRCCSMTSIQSAEVVDRISYTHLWKPLNGGEVYFTLNNIKSPLVSLKTYSASLIGSLQSSYLSKMPTVVEIKKQDTLVTFDTPNKTGKCPQNFFLYGIYQNESYRNADKLSDIEHMLCARYSNTYWNQCFEKQSQPLSQSCISNESCGPQTFECDPGTYFVGLRRGTLNTLYGLSHIVCCSMTSDSAAFKQ